MCEGLARGQRRDLLITRSRPQASQEGRLFVTILQRRANASQVQDCSYRHVCVDPWDLVLERAAGCAEIKELLI